jgi:hypothetical protein
MMSSELLSSIIFIVQNEALHKQLDLVYCEQNSFQIRIDLRRHKDEIHNPDEETTGSVGR